MTRPTHGTDAQTLPRFTISEDRGHDDVRPEVAEPARGPHFEVPRGGVLNCDFDGTADEFAARLREELAPTGVLEDLLVSRLIAAAWRLHERLGTADDGDDQGGPDIADLELALGRAVCTFERARSARRAAWGHAAPSESVGGFTPISDLDLDLSEDAADLAGDLGWSRRFESSPDDEADDRQVADDEDASDPGRLWRDRLILDPDVSDLSPVVKGTWITVGHVVSLVVDGWSWADILRAHPELSEDDIRACLTYSVEEEGSGSLGS